MKTDAPAQARVLTAFVDLARILRRKGSAEEAVFAAALEVEFSDRLRTANTEAPEAPAKGKAVKC